MSLLTVREAARALKVAASTVYKLCAEGALPHVRLSNAIRISSDALDYIGRGFRSAVGNRGGPGDCTWAGLPRVNGALFLLAGTVVANGRPDQRRLIRARAGLQAVLADSFVEPVPGDDPMVLRGA